MVLPDYQNWNCPICKFFYLKIVIPICEGCDSYGVIFFVQMIIKTVTAILAVFFEAFGVYCDGEFKWTCG